MTIENSKRRREREERERERGRETNFLQLVILIVFDTIFFLVNQTYIFLSQGKKLVLFHE